jgi:hypothetical protein
MLTSKNMLVVAGVSLGLLSGSVLAHADSSSQSFNIAPQNSASAPFVADNFDFQLFNSSLGTLNSVTVELNVTASASLSVQNVTGSSASFTNGFSSFPITVSGPPVGPTVYLTETALLSGVADTLGPFASQTYSETPTVYDSGAVPVAGSLLSFEAPGGGLSATDVTVAAGANTTGFTANPSTFAAGGNGAFGGPVTAGSPTLNAITIVYNYTTNAQNSAVPEPGTWALLVASAGVSVAGLRRRRAVK